MWNSELVKDINEILRKYGVNKEIGISDISITENIISDLVKPEAKLSNALIEFLWPSLYSKQVYHYTSKVAAESILGTQKFRFSNIERRYHEDEIITFVQTHNYDGYLEENSEGEPWYKTNIMKNMFYASFTDTNLSNDQEEYFWQTFATSDGVRLKLEITADHPDFRKIYYEEKTGKGIKILLELTGLIKEKYNRDLVIKGSSRICAFYLPGDKYAKENEYRALHRIWETNKIKGEGKDSYIEIPLDKENEFKYKIKVIEVSACEKPNMDQSYSFKKREL